MDRFRAHHLHAARGAAGLAERLLSGSKPGVYCLGLRSGYVWTYSENPEGLFEFQHMETLDKSSSDDGDSSKVNAQDIFEFSAINSGDVELNFILARPETGDDIQAQVSYSFSIDPSHNVKLVDSHGTLDVIPEPTISS